jgi:hypothetical protein
MSYDDSQRMGNSSRGSMGQRYDNNANYSPSTSFRRNNSGTGSYQGHNQQPRRRTDRFKRESLNHTDKLLRQNDIIISLLREIRDRLPPNPDIQQEYKESDSGIVDEKSDSDCENESSAAIVEQSGASQNSDYIDMRDGNVA